jgi:tRNA uridine 5-carboxymethylaminomethyl modification enzyme
LTGKGLEIGCVGRERELAHRDRMDKLARARALLQQLSLTSAAAARVGLPINQDGQRRSAYALLSFPEIDLRRLAAIWPELVEIDAQTAARVETDARYAVYLDRQSADIESYRRDEQLALPSTLDYREIGGLSAELCAKLSMLRPRTLGQAQRIEGVTPAALTLLAARARRG